jgi:hypothetical protein
MRLAQLGSCCFYLLFFWQIQELLVKPQTS